MRSTGNAATLWKWVSNGEGNLVITDVILPDENGLDLIPRIKKLRSDLRVIVMSAQNTLMTAVKATERGAFEYLPKPFDLKELVNAVERALTVSDSRMTSSADGVETEEQLPLIGRSPASQVFQLADVARPGICLQPLHRVRLQRLHGQTFRSGLGQEVTDKGRYVLDPLAQRRQAHRNDVQAVKKIFPEESLIHKLLQVAVRCGNDSDVRPDRCLPTHRRKLAFLEDP